MKKTLVDICNTEWEIREVNRATMKKVYGYLKRNEELDGYTDFDKQRIYISKDLHPHRKGITLVHELLHVIADASGDYSDDEQEDYIRRIEHGVYELLTKFPDGYK